MPIEYAERYTRADIRANRHKVFIFGDNLEGWGCGGQAREARCEPNTIGIPTKISPYIYLNDENFELWSKVAQDRLEAAKDVLRQGKTLVYPKNGVGTGLGRLNIVAPRIYAQLQAWIHELISLDK